MSAIGVIGGTGLYELPGLEVVGKEFPDTPYGAPSGPLVKAVIGDGQEVFFLPRHGEHHELLPHEINFRANLFALKSLGVTRCLSLCACGSMKQSIAPGDFVLADQIIDFTVRRNITFLEKGLSAYPSIADPLTTNNSARLAEAIRKNTQATVHTKGTYICIEGPHLSTRAESEMFRMWNSDIIGMTACPEVQLACEAQMDFTLLGMVSDYDCWHEEEEAVSVAGVLEVLQQSTKEIHQALPELLQIISNSERTPERQQSLSSALMIEKESAPHQEILSVLLK